MHQNYYFTLQKLTKTLFIILASTGIITPSSRLDYEDPSNRYFILNISVSDHGSPPLSSYVPVYINLTDFNDNYPEFIQASLTSEVKENLDPGILVTTVQARDADSGNNSLVRKCDIKICERSFILFAFDVRIRYFLLLIYVYKCVTNQSMAQILDCFCKGIRHRINTITEVSLLSEPLMLLFLRPPSS